MVKRHFLTLLTIVFAAVACEHPQPDVSAGDTPHARAREAFGRAVADARGLRRAALSVSPLDAGGEPYAALQTGALFAFRASLAERLDTVAQGFASAEGVIALPGNLKALLQECHVLEPGQRRSAADVAARLFWCLGEGAADSLTGQLYDADLMQRTGWEPLPGEPGPAWLPRKTGVMLRFHTMTQGHTGTWDLHQVSITVLPDYQIIVHREWVRP